MIRFDERPILVFWESTRACPLRCIHCRAEAILERLPGELDTDEAIQLIDSITRFGEPYPVLIITGGDPMMRDDLYEVIKYAVGRGLRIGLSPSVSSRLNDESIVELKRLGVKYVSISLDGSSGSIHDYIRGMDGHFNDTIRILRVLVEHGFRVQVNTLVSKFNVLDLPNILNILNNIGIHIWELFFLIRVGRGMAIRDLSPHEYEDTLHFLLDATRYGFEVRTVEAPFYRRIAIWRSRDEARLDPLRVGDEYGLGRLYIKLVKRMVELLGEPVNEPTPRIHRTRDGMGVIFISYNGEIYPSGFAPYRLGDVRGDDLVEVYRGNPILKAIRMAHFNGKCGVCEFRGICGGSRARALVEHNDILGSDPACIYNPSRSSIGSP